VALYGIGTVGQNWWHSITLPLPTITFSVGVGCISKLTNLTTRPWMKLCVLPPSTRTITDFLKMMSKRQRAFGVNKFESALKLIWTEERSLCSSFTRMSSGSVNEFEGVLSSSSGSSTTKRRNKPCTCG